LQTHVVDTSTSREKDASEILTHVRKRASKQHFTALFPIFII